ncbi:MAG: ADP-ribosylglycohydrolase family protein [Deltaproteobacteria bacterium]|nr:ADP-ribosylglycohydrolase family protein [Deltaproteobacteria bacterium]
MNLAKFIGSLLGTAIGDSLGAQGEGIFHLQGTKEIGPRYTDDTAMMIGLAESLIECKGFSGEHMANRFMENFEREPWRGYAWGPPRIFRMIRRGRKWNEMLDREIYPGGSYGNGAAMRIAPVGLFCHDDPKMLREVAYQSSQITHSHEWAIEGAALEACAVAMAVNLKAENFNKYEFLKELMNFTRVGIYQKKLEAMKSLLDEGAPRGKVIRELGNGVEAMNSVPAAIYSFLCNSDFESSVIYAVSLGGDADTIGAMTGAIAGACYGVDEITKRWMNRLENREYIKKLAEKLWEAKKGVKGK